MTAWGGCSHACCCRGETAPIHVAALRGQTSCIEFLITMKADVNARDRWMLLFFATHVFDVDHYKYDDHLMVIIIITMTIFIVMIVIMIMIILAIAIADFDDDHRHHQKP